MHRECVPSSRLECQPVLWHAVQTGNKGACAVSFTVAAATAHPTRFLCICCHLSPHLHKRHQRSNEYYRITAQLALHASGTPRTPSSLNSITSAFSVGQAKTPPTADRPHAHSQKLASKEHDPPTKQSSLPVTVAEVRVSNREHAAAYTPQLPPISPAKSSSHDMHSQVAVCESLSAWEPGLWGRLQANNGEELHTKDDPSLAPNSNIRSHGHHSSSAQKQQCIQNTNVVVHQPPPGTNHTVPPHTLPETRTRGGGQLTDPSSLRTRCVDDDDAALQQLAEKGAGVYRGVPSPAVRDLRWWSQPDHIDNDSMAIQSRKPSLLDIPELVECCNAEHTYMQQPAAPVADSSHNNTRRSHSYPAAPRDIVMLLSPVPEVFSTREHMWGARPVSESCGSNHGADGGGVPMTRTPADSDSDDDESNNNADVRSKRPLVGLPRESVCSTSNDRISDAATQLHTLCSASAQPHIVSPLKSKTPVPCSAHACTEEKPIAESARCDAVPVCDDASLCCNPGRGLRLNRNRVAPSEGVAGTQVVERRDGAAAIWSVPSSSVLVPLGSRDATLEFDIVLWMGDLNYRCGSVILCLKSIWIFF